VEIGSNGNARFKERLNKGWGMDEGNGDLLTGDGTG